MAILTINTVYFKDGNKTGIVTFSEQPAKKIMVWASAPFKDALTVGAKAEAKFEKMPAKDNFPEQTVLNSWDGVAMPERGGFKPGGGGGYKPTPRTPAEIHAASIAGVIKSCIEKGLDVNSSKPWVNLYTECVKELS